MLKENLCDTLVSNNIFYITSFLSYFSIVYILKLKYAKYRKILQRRPTQRPSFSWKRKSNFINIKYSFTLTAVSGRESTAADRDQPVYFTRPSTRPETDSTPIVARNWDTRSPCYPCVRNRHVSSGYTMSTRRRRKSSWSWNSKCTTFFYHIKHTFFMCQVFVIVIIIIEERVLWEAFV